MTPALDVLAKIVFSIVMVTGDFSRLDAEIESELRVIDQGARAAPQRAWPTCRLCVMDSDS